MQFAAVALEHFHHVAFQRGSVYSMFGLDNHVGRIVDYDIASWVLRVADSGSAMRAETSGAAKATLAGA